jgi:hypothetical protein
MTSCKPPCAASVKTRAEAFAAGLTVLVLKGRAADRAFLFDNSGEAPIWLAELTPERKLELKVDPAALPSWFRKWVPQPA